MRAPHDGVGRAAGVACALLMLAVKATQLPGARGAFGAAGVAAWTLETALAAAYVFAFVTRERARVEAKGFMETVFPILVSCQPLAITLLPYTTQPPALTGTAMALLVVGEAVQLWGVATLRRSFAFMAAARTLVRRGPFTRVRHPIYAGQFAAFLGYAILHASATSFLLYFTFVAGQIMRAWVEESKLAKAFPEYKRYRRETGMFFPRR